MRLFDVSGDCAAVTSGLRDVGDAMPVPD